MNPLALRYTLRLALAVFIAGLALIFAGPAFAGVVDGNLATPAGGPAAGGLSPELLTLANIAAVAAAIRVIVQLLKAKALGAVWLRVPSGVRVLLLAILTAVAGALESAARGEPPLAALTIALSGLGLAVASREMPASLKRRPR